MKLPKAKQYALEMVKGIRPGKIIPDPIGRLHRLHLDALEAMPSLTQVWAIETANYPPVRCAINGQSLTTTNPDGSVVLEYYPDGYPKIPDCLRRAPMTDSPRPRNLVDKYLEYIYQPYPFSLSP